MTIDHDVRSPEYLTGLSCQWTPSNFLFFDTETIPAQSETNPNSQVHHLRIWVAIACRIEYGIETRFAVEHGCDAESFWDLIESRVSAKQPLWIFSHNLGFDLTTCGFWDQLLNGKVEFKQEPKPDETDEAGKKRRKWHGCAVLIDPPTILKCRIKGTTKTLNFVDTLNWWPMSLAKLGESLNLPKMPMPAYDSSDRLWAEYCYRDVQIIHRAIMALVEICKRHQLGRFSYTASGQAYTAWRTKFFPQNVPILSHGNSDALRLERDAYYGGLSQIWWCGKVTQQYAMITPAHSEVEGCAVRPGPVVHLDIQSFYPSIMKREKFPVRIVALEHCPSQVSAERLVGLFGCAAYVLIDDPVNAYPLRTGAGTNYVTGRYRTSLCGPELVRAVVNNSIKGWITIAAYEMASIFAEFVDFFWHLKEKYRKGHNPAFSEMAKLMMNSLYGKFAQRANAWTSDPEQSAPIPIGYFWEIHLPERSLSIYRALAWNVDRKCEPAEKQGNVPIISAFVTAYGREEIRRLRTVAGELECLYSDTDSLHVTQSGYEALQEAGEIRPGEIGRLKAVEIADEATYRGRKNYTINGRDVIAGIKYNATKIDENKWRQSKFEGLSTIIGKGGKDTVTIEDVEIVIPPVDYGGRLQADGYVSPLRIEHR